MSSAEFRILLFDESKVAIKRLEETLNSSRGTSVSTAILPFSTHSLTPEVQQEIGRFQPDLVILDFIKGKAVQFSLDFIQAIRRISGLASVPVLIISTRINHSTQGRRTLQLCLDTEGVVAAFSKYPNYPPIETLLDFLPRRSR